MSKIPAINPDLLAKYLDVTNSPALQQDPVKQPRPQQVAKPIKKKPEGFVSILKEDVLWLNEKLSHIKNLTTNKMTVSLQRHLWGQGQSFVVKGFTYQNSEMDIMSLSNDFLTEYEIKSCRHDYVKDFGKMIFRGSMPSSKHAMMKAGKSIVNRFYYVCPPGLIDLDHLPDYAGLIYFEDPTPSGHLCFKMIKDAPLLHTSRVPPGFYKTLCSRIYDRYVNITRRYQHRSLLNFLSDGTDQENKNNSTDNTTTPGIINPNGCAPVPDSGRMPK